MNATITFIYLRLHELAMFQWSLLLFQNLFIVYIYPCFNLTGGILFEWTFPDNLDVFLSLMAQQMLLALDRWMIRPSGQLYSGPVVTSGVSCGTSMPNANIILKLFRIHNFTAVLCGFKPHAVLLLFLFEVPLFFRAG